LINSEFRESLSINDRGFSFGDGVFETIRIWKSTIPFWPEHFARLLKGLSILGIPIPDSFEEIILKDVVSLISANALSCNQSAVLKIIVTRGSGGIGYMPQSNAVPSIILMIKDDRYAASNSIIDQKNNKVFSLTCCKHTISSNPSLAGIKHLNRLDQVIASAELQGTFDEGLLLDVDGYVIEGTKSNLVCLNKGKWFMPKLSSCGIQGVMLKKFQFWLEKKKYPLIMQNLTMNDVLQAEHLFMMNSIMGIKEVTTFQGRKYVSSKEGIQIRRWLSESYGYE
jgi:4-amino-4-deoxychorismate lyase